MPLFQARQTSIPLLGWEDAIYLTTCKGLRPLGSYEFP